jgi:hypothetical protein
VAAIVPANPAPQIPAPIPTPAPPPVTVVPPSAATTPRSVAPAPQTGPANVSPPLRSAAVPANIPRPRDLDPSDPINAPMTLTPETAPPPQDPSLQMRPAPMDVPAEASRAASGVSPELRSSEARSPIDAPMTLTPQTAPRPQAESAPRTGAPQPLLQPER